MKRNNNIIITAIAAIAIVVCIIAGTAVPAFATTTDTVTYAIVTGSCVNVRNEPSDASRNSICGKVKSGELLRVLPDPNPRDSWVVIDYFGMQRYICSKYVKKYSSNTSWVVLTAKAKVYAKASTKSSGKSFTKGSTFNYVGVPSKGWVLVDVDGTAGYVRKSNCKIYQSKPCTYVLSKDAGAYRNYTNTTSKFHTLRVGTQISVGFVHNGQAYVPTIKAYVPTSHLRKLGAGIGENYETSLDESCRFNKSGKYDQWVARMGNYGWLVTETGGEPVWELVSDEALDVERISDTSIVLQTRVGDMSFRFNGTPNNMDEEITDSTFESLF